MTGNSQKSGASERFANLHPGPVTSSEIANNSSEIAMLVLRSLVLRSKFAISILQDDLTDSDFCVGGAQNLAAMADKKRDKKPASSNAEIAKKARELTDERQAEEALFILLSALNKAPEDETLLEAVDYLAARFAKSFPRVKRNGEFVYVQPLFGQRSSRCSISPACSASWQLAPHSAHFAALFPHHRTCLLVT